MMQKPNEAWEEFCARYRAGYEPLRDKVMMGTSAMGGGTKKVDISRDEEDYFVVDSETDHFYIGAWVTGFGFFNVAFPKATSRPVTDEEWEWFLSNPVALV